MKKITLISMLCIAVLFAGCSKDQKVVRQLDGEWKVSSMTVDGTSADKEDYEKTTYTFEKCKVKKGDCSGTMKYDDPSKGNTSMSFNYNISDKGETIMIKFNFFGFSLEQKGKILEHSKTNFKYEYEEVDEDDNGNTVKRKYVIGLTKI